MATIKDINAREILDSRGYPTIEATVILSNNISARASVPGGLLKSSYESKELRDNDLKRYDGYGVLMAIKKISEIIAPKLIGHNISKQSEIDQILIDLDGTNNKSNLGANTTLAVSLACARAAAQSEKIELYSYLQKTFKFPDLKIPVPFFNVFNGGEHADTNLDFQEFIIIPQAPDIFKNVEIGAAVFHELGRVLEESDYDTDLGSEGGYAPDLDSSIEALELILAATIRADYKPGVDLKLGINIGSSILYDKDSGKYLFSLDNGSLNSLDLISLYEDWFKKYPFLYLEDALAEDAYADWGKLTAALGDKIIIAGSNLFATKIDRLREGLKTKAANAIVIKPNQVGTLTETMDCVRLAKAHGYKIIISQRGAETNDDFI
ncbi:MAG: phosphopyruvate hydratase, partial [Patescibacteria group bacterium]